MPSTRAGGVPVQFQPNDPDDVFWRKLKQLAQLVNDLASERSSTGATTTTIVETLPAMGSPRLLGRATGTGPPTELSPAEVNTLLPTFTMTLNGLVVSPGAATGLRFLRDDGAWALFEVADNSITNAKLRDSAALSVIGRASNTPGDPADIIASAEGDVLQRDGNTLIFAPVRVTPLPVGVDGDDGADAPVIPGSDGRDGIDGYTIPGRDGECGEPVVIPGRDGINGLDGYTIRGEDGDDGESAAVIPGERGPAGTPALVIPGEAGEDGTDGALIFSQEDNPVFTSLTIREGANAKMGTATFVSGTVVVSTTAVTATSRIFVFVNSGTLTNVGFHWVSARTAGTSFTLSSSDALDASTVAWIMFEPR